ncbi:3-isopropylmalate dehydratase small subunit [Synechococcus sp. Cruz-9H2]|jgi:3-isopropylmalate/(R)-2-methylmalate dehydratase small subunit|uniref:3-isopropylmalate dehydratase small subunit n=1 Tax=unclassified Synechococcus TaxID=2626047 RepID=UPI0020CE9ABB|nr:MULTISPECIES: 3-isopropylmalate dehydratase small subunit [unclassified Synechococcus]MCP9819335.1 3-isopropylmalate dehydratase small subunit [Synechococcus sp. Cruz-9H2]MCP9843128.1 3-isopropylmalate dehydratase small subunit [Synechococcus sp. Edmonson 11F2]MCP9854873.1 3-isopropylmalate dehydratase small subunit [Synechococcus sp. Cruz-9C9]MCP9862656.1 3-isopropylmalate dehydratase small subunit [Synechococcus sp. Cruz-7E5]MCP9870245.1 3-isopropylmalate dehydratase small subunit [Synech
MSDSPFPFGPIPVLQGRVVVVSGDDIDTDRIIPARYLKCVTFEGLAHGAFADDRLELEGSHPFDRPEHQGASILVVNRNFGCGSSREHAPQALMRWGIRAVVGESFAEIFFGNCLALGIPCLSGDHATILALQQAALRQPDASFRLDLATAEIHSHSPGAAAESTQRWSLELAAGPRQMLLSGQWNATGQLLSHDEELVRTAARLPYLAGFALV